VRKELTDEQKAAIVVAHQQGTQGSLLSAFGGPLSPLAEALIRRHEAVKKAFAVEPLPDGAFPRFPRAPKGTLPLEDKEPVG